MRFTKMHGLGNDYVYVDGFTETVDDPAALAVAIADRHFGVGGDGLILALPPTDEAAPNEQGQLPGVRMRMFNADGSEAEMCGNGIRCVCKLVHDHDLGGFRTNRSDSAISGAIPGAMLVETGNGVLSLAYTLGGDGTVETVAVDMGRPVLDLPGVPVDEGRLDDRLDGAVFVGMGNPHAVLFVEDDRPLEQPGLGAELEHHPAFPNRMNVHFVRPRKDRTGGLSRTEVDVYHWERGSGATLACGTGACAVAVAGVVTGRTDRTLTAHLPGGALRLDWPADDAAVTMTGPAVEVFTGEWPEP